VDWANIFATTMANATWTAESKLIDEGDGAVDDRIMLTRVAEELGPNLVGILEEHRERDGLRFRKHALTLDQTDRAHNERTQRVNAMEDMVRLECCHLTDQVRRTAKLTKFRTWPS
jgi:hypothetical protein